MKAKIALILTSLLFSCVASKPRATEKMPIPPADKPVKRYQPKPVM